MSMSLPDRPLRCSDFVAYGKGANAARLAHIKAKYDPTNFLRELKQGQQCAGSSLRYC